MVSSLWPKDLHDDRIIPMQLKEGNTAEILPFNHVLVWLKLRWDGVQTKNYKNCIFIQQIMNLTVWDVSVTKQNWAEYELKGAKAKYPKQRLVKGSGFRKLKYCLTVVLRSDAVKGSMSHKHTVFAY